MDHHVYSVLENVTQWYRTNSFDLFDKHIFQAFDILSSRLSLHCQKTICKIIRFTISTVHDEGHVMMIIVLCKFSWHACVDLLLEEELVLAMQCGGLHLTCHSSVGQTLDWTVLDCLQPVFCHGQLYTAI